MCGIAGIIGNFADKRLIAPMTSAMAHRGPDDYGVWIDPVGGIVLGHTRLSIIDLSPAGHQPMAYAAGRYQITFNGEIYNYRELRQELEANGLAFTTHTDTEVVLAAFAQWGTASLSRMRGMFAFAIWDKNSRKLFLARDRMGIKPLLYASTPKGFVFASELRTLLESDLVERKLNPDAVADLLAWGSVCQPRTFIHGVNSLMPGTWMEVDTVGKLTTGRYWAIEEAGDLLRENYAGQSFADLVAITRSKLEDACRAHLVADVPVGSFLSGGVDSSAVTALMAHIAPYPIKTFSVGFDQGMEFASETDYARKAAERIGCEHTEVILTCKDVARQFDDLANCIDQPSNDGTNTYFVSQAASKQVKVTLSGLGGDELFGGYPHFAVLANAAEQDDGILTRVVSLAYRLRPNRYCQARYLSRLSLPNRYGELRRILSEKRINHALAPDIRHSLSLGEGKHNPEVFTGNVTESVAQTSIIECRNYLCNTLLRDNDAMSMAHSLEVRPVLLDHELVEHALALPVDAKIRDGVGKAVLVEAVRDLVPYELLQRKKMGFELPLGSWLFADLRERLLDHAGSASAREVFDKRFLVHVPRIVGDQAHSRELWSFMVFMEWKNRLRIH